MPMQVNSMLAPIEVFISVESLLAKKVVAAEGIVSREITKIAPTTWMRTTTERATRQSKKMYKGFTESPCKAACCSSKQMAWNFL